MIERYDATSLELRFPAQPDSLRGVRDALRERLARWGLTGVCARDVVMAVDEACQNVIRHAYRGRADGRIELALHHAGDELRVSVRDFAPSVDPARIRPRRLATLRPGGLGTHWMHSVMHQCELGKPRSGSGNLLRMVKRLRVQETARPCDAR